MDGWMGGWMDGWMDGSKSRVKDCLQQSKNKINIKKYKIMVITKNCKFST